MKPHLPCSLLSALLAVFALAAPIAYAVEIPEGYTSYYLSEPDELSSYKTSTEKLAFLLDGSLTITPDSAPWWTNTTPLKKNGSILFTIEEDGDPFSMTFKDGSSYPAFINVSYLGFQDIGYVTFQNIRASYGSMDNATTVEFFNNRGIDFKSNASSSYGTAVNTASLSIKGTTQNINFTDNSACGFGGAIYGTTVNIENNKNISFSNNHANDDCYQACGGAISGADNSTINLSDNSGSIIFSDNDARSDYVSWSSHEDTVATGGAIQTGSRSVLNLNNNTGDISFCNNHAYGCGGSDGYISGGLYRTYYTYSSAKGGAIYIDANSTFNIRENIGSVLFEGNYVENSGSYLRGAYGGAVCAGSSSTVNVVDNVGSITFKGNYASAENSSIAYGGAIYIGSSGFLNVNGNEKDVLFTTNDAYNGGAIYAGSGSTLNFEATSGSIVFDSNTAVQGGAIHGEGCTININNSSGDINFLNNESTSYGGAIYDTSSVINICNNTGKIKFYGNTASTGAAIYGGDLIIQNNESVVFERNLETSGRLRSIYLDNAIADGGKFHVSAAEGKAITFTDSVYVQTSTSGHTVDVVFNGSYTAADESVIAQGGDIIFDGSQVESILNELLDTAPTSTQIEDSLTSYIGGVINLKAGRLIVRGGAQLNGLGLSTTARSGAAMVLENAGMNHSSGSINIRRETSLELSGSNQITAGSLSFASASTLKFTIGAEQVTTANLTLDAKLEHFSFGIALDGEEMLASGRYKLVALADASQYVDGGYWNADDITMTATGDAAGLGFDDLVWEDGVLYVEQGKSIWTNAGGDGTWNTTSTNWSRNGLGITYRDGMDVLFDGTAAGTVQLVGEVAPLSVTVENAAGQDYTFSGSGKLTGSTGIVKDGEGELSLATANEHTGGTQLNGGSLRVQHSSALGATTATLSTAAGSRLSIENGAQVVLAAAEGNDLAGSVSIAAGASLEMQGSGYRAESTQLAGELIFNNTGVSQQAGSLSGSGHLKVQGAGTAVQFASAASYAGSVSLANGATLTTDMLKVGADATLAALAAGTSVSLGDVVGTGAAQVEMQTTKFESYTGTFNADVAANTYTAGTLSTEGGLVLQGGATYQANGSSIDLGGSTLTLAGSAENPFISLMLELDKGYTPVDTQIVLFSGVSAFNVGGVEFSSTETAYVFSASDYLKGEYVFETTALVYDGNVGVVYLVEAVPEPATTTLSLLALAGLAARRRRKE